MSRTNFNLVEGSLSYEAPSVKTLDIVVEGVLCSSTYEYTLGGGGKYDTSHITDNGEY